MNEIQTYNLTPQQAFTRSGVRFDPSAPTWSIVEERGSRVIDFRTLTSCCAMSIVEGAKATAVELLRTHSVDTVYNAVQRLSHLAETIDLKDKIDANDLINYRSRLRNGHLHYLGHISSFIKRWVELRYPGVNSDVVGFFKAVRIPGNEKGAAVRQRCPYTGPFTDLELQALVENAREAFRVGKLNPVDHAIFLLLTTTGARPGQISMLICGDLVPPRPGHSAWLLRVPSLKKRTARRLTRDRPIPTELARLLAEQARAVGADERLTGVDPALRPLFVAASKASFLDVRMAHIGREGVDAALRRIAGAISVRSERTGEPMNLKSVRFRRTLGTRAIEEGYAPIVVAEMLDHADLQNVAVYVENRSSIVDRIDAVLAEKLGPIARLFLGKIINREAEAGVDDPVARRVGTGHARLVGTCGGPSGCTRLAPIACYTCASFMPWRDAPHERLLQALIDERDRLLAAGIDERIAGVNDASILAIADVIERCKPQAEVATHG